MATDPLQLRVAVLVEFVQAMGACMPPGAREATRIRLAERRQDLAREFEADPEARDELYREFDALFSLFRI